MRHFARTATTLTLAICAALVPLAATSQSAAPATPAGQMQHVDWSKSANI